MIISYLEVVVFVANAEIAVLKNPETGYGIFCMRFPFIALSALLKNCEVAPWYIGRSRKTKGKVSYNLTTISYGNKNR